MQLQILGVLSDSEIEQIHDATIQLLVETGIQMDSTPMLDALAAKGLDIDRQNGRVRFTQSCIDDALGTIPSLFTVHDREGEEAFVLGDARPKIAAGHNAVFWLDSETGQTRPSTIADVQRFARICQALPNIDMIGIPVMPQDIPNPRASLLYGVEACVTNSSKPIFFSTDDPIINRGVIRMLEAVYGGDFSQEAYGITQLSPTSPLYWESSVCQAILDTLQTNVPIAILPEPNAGVSSPYTLAGLLTVNNVECISGLVMIQLLKPGTEVMYANSWTTTDMKTGVALVGSAETTLCRIAAAQLARFYKTPSHTTAPNSDNHAHDEQNAWEKTLSMFCAVGAGHDLTVNCGMFATGMTCSHEQLVMDEEMSAMSRRIAEGITVNDETIGTDAIAEVGPRGDYLTHDHTLNWLRSDEYFAPRLAVRGLRAAWQAQGGRDTVQLAREQAELLSQQNAPLAGTRADRLTESRVRAESSLDA